MRSTTIALNFSRHAVPDLGRYAGVLASADMPEAATVTRALRDHLAESQKFILPKGGRILGGDITANMFPAFRLPFPVVAAEYLAADGNDGLATGWTNSSSVPKRIALAIEMPCPEAYRTETADDGMGAIIWPIDFRNGYWHPSWCGAWVPYGLVPVPVSQDEKRSRAAELERLGVATEDGGPHRIRDFSIRAAFPVLGEPGRKIASDDRDRAYVAAQLDTKDEVAAIVQMCAALACSNVSTELHEPTPKQVRTATRRGALPFDSYRILVVDGQPSQATGSGGGTHASPRTHLRRGHIRCLSSGRRIWVNSTVVNPGAGGFVHKEYAVAS